MATSYSPFSLDSSALYFNPYSVGIWSATLAGSYRKLTQGPSQSLFYWNMACDYVLRTYYPEIYKGLNPYSTGIWSATLNYVTKNNDVKS